MGREADSRIHYEKRPLSQSALLKETYRIVQQSHRSFAIL